MERKIGIFVDWDRTLVYTDYFYILNPYIFLKNFVHSMASFLRYAVKDKNLNPLNFAYYFLLEEDKRSDEIISRIRKGLGLYIDKNLMKLIVKLSKNENYDVKIISSSSEKIIKGVSRELEKVYGENINVDVIASSPDKLVTSKTKGEIVKKYNGLTICFADGSNDTEFLNNCDVPIVKSSLAYYFYPKKPIGYKPGRKKFEEFLEKLEKKLIPNDFYQ
jgi:phosphoserine phosphatase